MSKFVYHVSTSGVLAPFKTYVADKDIKAVLSRLMAQVEYYVSEHNKIQAQRKEQGKKANWMDLDDTINESIQAVKIDTVACPRYKEMFRIPKGIIKPKEKSNAVQK